MQSTSNNTTIKKVQLRREGSVLTGVCSGVAEYFGADVTLVRLGAARAGIRERLDTSRIHRRCTHFCRPMKRTRGRAQPSPCSMGRGS